MLIREFTEKDNFEDVDLLDDLDFFMNNDRQFYRRDLFPLISHLRNQIKSGKKCKDTLFRNCVDKAIDVYCKKFDITNDQKSVFTDVDRDELARKIFAKEQENINNGVYDGDCE